MRYTNNLLLLFVSNFSKRHCVLSYIRVTVVLLLSTETSATLQRRVLPRVDDTTFSKQLFITLIITFFCVRKNLKKQLNRILPKLSFIMILFFFSARPFWISINQKNLLFFYTTIVRRRRRARVSVNFFLFFFLIQFDPIQKEREMGLQYLLMSFRGNYYYWLMLGKG